MRRTPSSIDTAMQCSKPGILPTGIEAGHRQPQVLIELCSASRGFRIYNIQIYQKLTHGFWLAEAGRTNAACLDALNAKNWIPKEASKSADLATAECHVWFRIVYALPIPNSALQGAAGARCKLGMAVRNFPKNNNGTQPRCGNKHWDDFVVPNACKTINAAASSRLRR